MSEAYAWPDEELGILLWVRMGDEAARLTGCTDSRVRWLELSPDVKRIHVAGAVAIREALRAEITMRFVADNAEGAIRDFFKDNRKKGQAADKWTVPALQTLKDEAEQAIEQIDKARESRHQKVQTIVGEVRAIDAENSVGAGHDH